MKKLWKGLCTAAAFMAIWICCTTVCFAGTVLDNGTFKYEADFNNDTCKITGYLGNDAVVNIPESIDGCRVVTLGNSCFSGNKNVVKVNIPSTIRTVEGRAFVNSGLKEITIPETVTSLGGAAFNECYNLEKAVIKAPVTKIEMFTFENCYNLKSVILPNTIKEIDSYAFLSCTNLTSVNIPSSLKKLNRAVFQGCSSLTSIDLRNCEVIGTQAFYGCTSLQTVKLEKCRVISDWAFRNCKSLKEIRIPKSVEGIYACAFLGCSSLEKAYVCNANTEMGSSAFESSPIFTLYGYSGSSAQRFAKSNGIRFQDIRTAEPAVTSITLNAKSGNMKVGNTFTLKATVKPDNAIIKSVTWTSSNSKVASVSSSGKVTAKQPGTAVITGKTINGKAAKCTINVRPVGTPVTKLQSQRKGWLNIQYRANRKANGYQMQYGTSSNMKGAKYAAVNNSAIRSYTRKDVKSGAIYYVRVRTFNVVNGKRIYSDWSGIKRMRVK